MELILATDAWHPQVNGVVRTLSTTMDHLGRMGVQCRVIHPGLFRSFAYPFYPDIRLALPTRSKIETQVGKAVPSFVHIATEGPVGWAMRNHCLRRKWRFTSAFHTHFPQYLWRFPGIPTFLTWRILRWFHQASSGVMVATPSLSRELAKQGFDPKKIKMWQRGVDTQRFRPRVKSPRSKPIALYVGRVSTEKNIEAFLKVDRPVEKWIVGDGPDRASLQKSHPEAKWYGMKQGEELSELYSEADVFVFPSRTDTFGLVMLEAMASGVPVAAFPVEGPIDVVRPGAGVLDEDLGKAIDGALLCDPVTCRSHALKWTWESCSREFLSNLVPAVDLKPLEKEIKPRFSASA